MAFNSYLERPKSQVNYPFSPTFLTGQNYNNNIPNYSNSTYGLNNQLNGNIEQKGTMEIMKYNFEVLQETFNNRTENSGIMISLTAKPGFDKYSTAELRSIDYRNKKNGLWNNNNRQLNSNYTTTNASTSSINNIFMNGTNNTSSNPNHLITNSNNSINANFSFNNVPTGNNVSFGTNYQGTNQFFNTNSFTPNYNNNSNNNPLNTNTNNVFNTSSNNTPFNTNNNNIPFNMNTNTNTITNNNNNPFNTPTNNLPFNTNYSNNNNYPFNTNTVTNNINNNPFNNATNNPFASNTNPFNTQSNYNKFIINANTNPNSNIHITREALNQSIITNVSNIPLSVNPLSFSFEPNKESNRMNSNNQANPSPLYYIQPYFDLKNNQFFIDNCSPIIGESSSSDSNFMSFITKLNTSTMNLYKENNKGNLFSDRIEMQKVDYCPPIQKPFPSFEKPIMHTNINLPQPKDKNTAINNLLYTDNYNDGIEYKRDDNYTRNDHNQIKQHKPSLSLNCYKTYEKSSNDNNSNYYQSNEYLKEIESLGNEACTTRKYKRPSYDFNLNSNNNDSPSLDENTLKSTRFNKEKEENSIEIQRNQATPIKNPLFNDQSLISPINPNKNPSIINEAIKLTFRLNQSMFNNITFELRINEDTSIKDLKSLVIEKISQLCSVKLQVNQITFYNSKGVIDDIIKFRDQHQTININISDYSDNALRKPIYPIITKYQTIPTVNDIMKMTYDQLSHVKDLTIYNEHGRITFKEECDLNKVDVDEILTIKPYYLSCYLGIDIPPCGTGLNKPARIELFSIETDDDGDDKSNENITNCLKETVKQLGGIYVDYIDETLIFDVEQFKHKT